MREGKFIETKKESTNTFVERSKEYDAQKFEKEIFDYQKNRQRRDSLIKMSNTADLIKEPSREQKKIIKTVIEEAALIINRYSQREIRMSASNIFLISPEDARKKFEDYEDHEIGRSDAGGAIYLYVSQETTASQLAHSLAHELVHLYGYNRFRAMNEEGKEEFITDRGGLSIGDPKRGYDEKSGGHEHFKALNEAVTEKLAILISRGIIVKTKILEKDFQILDDMYGKEKSPEIYFLTTIINEEGNAEFSWGRSYPELLEKFEEVCYELYQKNRDRFRSADDVFQVFAQAYCTGKLLTLARLIEKTYGKGAFRKLGEL